VGSGAKSPSPLAPFAYDWIGGDIGGLSAYAGTLYRYVPEISDVTNALDSKVKQVVNAAGWQGSAASAFSSAWERDAIGATALSVVISGVGDVVNTLAVNLSRIEHALEQAADQTEAHGVQIGADGEPPQVCLANPSQESWRAAYQSFWNQCMLTASNVRTQAAGALQTLYGKLTAEPGSKGLQGGDYASLFDVLAGFWGAQTRYRSYLEAKIPGLKQQVSQAMADAREEARQADGKFGPWTDEGRENFGDAKTELSSVEGNVADAQATENPFSKFWGFSPSDIPAVSDALDGVGGFAGTLAKFAADVPVVDVAAAVAGTYFSAQQDIRDGVPWEFAYPGELAGQTAAIGTGAVVGNLAMGAATAGLTAAGVDAGLGLTVAAGGVGVLAGGIAAYGVGDFVHHMIDQNWSADISHDGVLLGIGKGVGDSVVETGEDFGHIASSIWHSIF
jgi:uncharacterized protein YukE